jgi:hypothetical protein
MVTSGMASGRSLPLPSFTVMSMSPMPRSFFVAAFTLFGSVVIFSSDR